MGMFKRRERLTDKEKHTLKYRAEARERVRRERYELLSRFTVQGTGYLFGSVYALTRTGTGLVRSGSLSHDGAEGLS